MNSILRNPLAHAKLKFKIELLRTVAIMMRRPYARACIDLLSKNERLYRVFRSAIQWARARDSENDDIEKKLKAMTPEAREILKRLKLKISEVKAA